MAEPADDERLELLPGTLDMLILRTLQWGAQRALATVATTMRQEVQPTFPTTVPLQIRTMDEQIERGLGRERVMALLGTAFGMLTLAPAAVGLYGVLSYRLARRTNEIGIRIALGTKRAQLLSSVLRDAIWMLTIGVALGLPMVWIMSRLTASLLFGLLPNDPATVAGAAAVLFFVGLAASLFPARNASQVDPVTALRNA